MDDANDTRSVSGRVRNSLKYCVETFEDWGPPWRRKRRRVSCTHIWNIDCPWIKLAQIRDGSSPRGTEVRRLEPHDVIMAVPARGRAPCNSAVSRQLFAASSAAGRGV